MNNYHHLGYFSIFTIVSILLFYSCGSRSDFKIDMESKISEKLEYSVQNNLFVDSFNFIIVKNNDSLTIKNAAWTEYCWSKNNKHKIKVDSSKIQLVIPDNRKFIPCKWSNDCHVELYDVNWKTPAMKGGIYYYKNYKTVKDTVYFHVELEQKHHCNILMVKK